MKINPEVHKLATELARLRKVSVAKAVYDAVQHELAAEKARQRRDKLCNQLLEIGKRCAANMSGKTHSSHHAALYDRKGLPSQVRRLG